MSHPTFYWFDPGVLHAAAGNLQRRVLHVERAPGGTALPDGYEWYWWVPVEHGHT